MGDDIAIHKIGVIKHLTKNALGEDMLDDHLLHGGVGEVGVEGLAAEPGEVVKGLNEARVGKILPADQFQEGGGVLRQSIFELGHGLLPFLKMGRLIIEEGFEGLNQRFRAGDILIKILPAILVNDGPMRGLEENVVTGITGVKFLLNLLFQVVSGVLGFPVAMGQPEVVEQGAVQAQGVAVFLEGILLHKGEAALFGAVAQQGGKGRGDGAFGVKIEISQVLEFVVVGFDDLMRRLEVEAEHKELLAIFRG